jgi:hypothetical protein
VRSWSLGLLVTLGSHLTAITRLTVGAWRLGASCPHCTYHQHLPYTAKTAYTAADSHFRSKPVISLCDDATQCNATQRNSEGLEILADTMIVSCVRCLSLPCARYVPRSPSCVKHKHGYSIINPPRLTISCCSLSLSATCSEVAYPKLAIRLRCTRMRIFVDLLDDANTRHISSIL